MKFEVTDTYSKELIDELITRATAGKVAYYKSTDRALHEALADYPINELDVAVMGSVYPWYEAICLAHSARPVTIDYNSVDYRHPGITTMTVEEFKATPQEFDVALSISSFEHDGMGKYGEPLDPDGDLRAMNEMKDIVKPEGLLFLSVPTGGDAVVPGKRRVYGETRLPKLLHGWELLSTYGGYRLSSDGDGVSFHQPVFVLMNVGTVT